MLTKNEKGLLIQVIVNLEDFLAEANICKPLFTDAQRKCLRKIYANYYNLLEGIPDDDAQKKKWVLISKGLHECIEKLEGQVEVGRKCAEALQRASGSHPPDFIEVALLLASKAGLLDGKEKKRKESRYE